MTPSSKKKDLEWLLVSHHCVDPEQVIDIFSKQDNIQSPICCKFEPFVLHVQCRTMDKAEKMLKVALDAGYRNSGIMVGKKKKYMVGVRSTPGAQVPLAFNDNVRVTDEYIRCLVSSLNENLKMNFNQINRFGSAFKLEFSALDAVD